MATPSSTPRGLTGDKLIDVATHGYYWQLDSTHTLNWSLADGFFGEYWTNPVAAVNTLNTVFKNISTYANIGFHYVGYYSDPSVAYSAGSDITISLGGTQVFGSDVSTWAVGLFPDSEYNISGYQGAPGDIFLNIDSLANFLPSYAPGSAGYALAIHEIGHTLGLKHPFDDGGTGHPTLESIGLAGLDIDWFTVMAYNDDYNFNVLAWDPATPMVMDVLALQYLFGKNMHTNASNTTYTFSLSQTYRTIWDAGGIDTIDASHTSVGWTINLPDYQLSLLVDTKVGLAVPTAETYLTSPLTFYWLTGDIENLMGSIYSDDLIGSRLSNTINGNAGNDTIDGQGGSDVLKGWTGNDAILGGTGADTIDGGAGNDTVAGNQDNDVIFGGDGFDSLRGSKGDDYLQGNANGDSIVGGLDNDEIHGGNGFDDLRGSKGDDLLIGGLGNDTLNGGIGNDILWGSGGNDMFVFDQPGDGFYSGHDTIMDFVVGEDVISLAAFANDTGITTVDDVFDRISSDGDGGTLLDLGRGFYVDIVDVDPTALGADDFLIT